MKALELTNKLSEIIPIADPVNELGLDATSTILSLLAPFREDIAKNNDIPLEAIEVQARNTGDRRVQILWETCEMYLE